MKKRDFGKFSEASAELRSRVTETFFPQEGARFREKLAPGQTASPTHPPALYRRLLITVPGLAISRFACSAGVQAPNRARPVFRSGILSLDIGAANSARERAAESVESSKRAIVVVGVEISPRFNAVLRTFERGDPLAAGFSRVHAKWRTSDAPRDTRLRANDLELPGTSSRADRECRFRFF